MIYLLFILSLFGCTYGIHNVEITNNCANSIDLAILCHSTGKAFALPFKGGTVLAPKETVAFDLPVGWGGRFWGRTQCDAQGKCLTGDCGQKVECNGLSGKPPCTLAEIQFDGGGTADWYDISNVDGFNLPISMAPVPGTFKRRSSDIFDCGNATCPKDINQVCPKVLQLKSPDGTVIACDSACNRFNKDSYCCRGSFNDPKKCIPAKWDINFAKIFKDACPVAYSYAYDDKTSTFVCQGNPQANYTISFC